ncbi:hypothetical protein Patl1_07607 [Pistacia atlantica]|uniref:Uncharacterized protein n=1 Tax=Pistacia atlantica TaxID=434234 RepID=A0ACC1AFM5_9ROSI|nr:hypothetical protein Patl1_07607 [Pistacia atlantica]
MVGDRHKKYRLEDDTRTIQEICWAVIVGIRAPSST